MFGGGEDGTIGGCDGLKTRRLITKGAWVETCGIEAADIFGLSAYGRIWGILLIKVLKKKKMLLS